jgi:hypothetical protein
LLVICAEQHKQRVQFLFHKFFGPKYTVSYLAVKSPRFTKNVTGNEAACLKDQKALLAKVRVGHEEDFAHKLYTSTYYTKQAESARISPINLKG